MTISNQIMKGLLDGAILGLIAKGETYGYEILEKLKEHQFPEISDGSIYPVLLRLDKKVMYIQPCVNRIMVPNRKYYTISESGLKELQQFKEKWQALNKGMNHIFRSDNDDK